MQVVATTTEGPVINLLYSWEVDTIFKGLRISRIYGSEGSITFESNGIFVWTRGKKKKFKFPNLPNITGQKLMLMDFVSAIKSGNAPEFNWKMAQQDLQLIESVYSSIQD
jgi:predicted dehydrogenase